MLIMATSNKINIADNIIETIGRTPLVRLNQGRMLVPKRPIKAHVPSEELNPKSLPAVLGSQPLLFCSVHEQLHRLHFHPVPNLEYSTAVCHSKFLLVNFSDQLHLPGVSHYNARR